MEERVSLYSVRPTWTPMGKMAAFMPSPSSRGKSRW